MTGPDPISDARLAAQILGVGSRLGGLALRARAGPLRSAYLTYLRDIAAAPIRRLPPGIDDARLLGGLDLAEALSTGRPVHARGLLDEVGAGTLILPMAERAASGLAARIGAALDAGAGFSVVALDEGVEAEEHCPAALTDRLALHLTLEGLRARPLPDAPAPEVLGHARRLLAAMPPTPPEAFVEAAAALGIASMRAPLLALEVARGAAAIAGRDNVAAEDAALAARLVLAPRATSLPPADETQPAPEPPAPSAPDDAEKTQDPTPSDGIPAEVLLEAARASLPPDVLAKLRAGAAAARVSQACGGAGAVQNGTRRGRPMGSRPGDPRGPHRLDLVATLRTAAPWQPLRRKLFADPPAHILISKSDIRVRRHRQRRERLALFLVDASGSTAMGRLAEAKGAIELLLAEAYVRRDHVALIAMRGAAAETLLPPTRSLVQTKRRLAALPGGGGTPLASGLEAALTLALGARRRGRDPVLVVLTDGKANIARDGRPGRAAARADAEEMARVLRGAALPTLLIDTSPRPQRPAAELAAALDATYLPLPRADARGIGQSVGALMAAP